VHVNGLAVKSCMLLAVQADGATIDTVEGFPIITLPPARVIGLGTQLGLGPYITAAISSFTRRR